MVTRRDPYRNFKFKVTFSDDPGTVVGFRSISGLSEETAVLTYAEGDKIETDLKIPGRTSYPNLVLEKGMTNTTFVLDWRKLILDRNKREFQSPDNTFRKDLTIRLLNKSGLTAHTWRVINAWPAVLSFTDLSTDGDGEIMIETMELAHEGVYHVRSANPFSEI